MWTAAASLEASAALYEPARAARGAPTLAALIRRSLAAAAWACSRPILAPSRAASAVWTADSPSAEAKRRRSSGVVTTKASFGFEDWTAAADPASARTIRVPNASCVPMMSTDSASTIARRVLMCGSAGTWVQEV